MNAGPEILLVILNIRTIKLSDSSSECPDKNSTSPKFLSVSSVSLNPPPPSPLLQPTSMYICPALLVVQEPRPLPAAPTEFTCHGALPGPSEEPCP